MVICIPGLSDGIHFHCGNPLVKYFATKIKSPEQFKVIVLTWPHVKEEFDFDPSKFTQCWRFPFTGTAHEIGSDLQRISEMGIAHVIFNYNFLPGGRNVKRIIDLSKGLTNFAK